jgi:hypothetical protein
MKRLDTIATIAIGLLTLGLLAGCRGDSAPDAGSEAEDRQAGAAVPVQLGGLRLPSDTVRFSVLIQGNEAGSEEMWVDETGHVRFHFAFNDRGRGPDLDARVGLNERGIPVVIETSGVDYLKSPVEERFQLQGSTATWKNQGEDGSRELDGDALFIPMNGTPAMGALAARALLQAPDWRLPLLPAGDMYLEKVEDRRFERTSETGTESITATQYAISGLGFSPSYVWLDEAGLYFGSADGWFGVVREGWDAALPEMHAAQQERNAAWLGQLAEDLPERPTVAVAIQGARLFDPHTLSMTPGVTVVVEGNRIAAVGPDGEVSIPSEARVVDAEGKTLLPGLFDMHVHLSPIDGVLHMAAGVTTVRDMANDIDQLLDMRQRFDDGTAIGPRVIMAGFMDGPGPYAGPTKVLVDTEAEIREWIARYDSLGYEQIKIYSSIETELVPAITDAAREHGMKVSGHIPAFMTAEQAVLQGFSEITHANMLFLNFQGDTLDTRTPARFTAVAQYGAELDLESDSVQDFLQLLKDREVIVDPTVSIWEGMFTGRPGEVSPNFESVADRLPPTVRRGYLAGGLPVPDEMDMRYRESFQRILDMVAEVYEQGITIVPGTDAMAGFALHRELELYERAGIPAAQVLRIATLGSAEVAGRADQLGSIEPGKLADMILVDGDPTARMSDIRNVRLVMKDGVLFDAASLYRAIGVAP